MAFILKNGVKPGGSPVSGIQLGRTEVKYITDGEGSLYYDIQREIIYDKPELKFSYPELETPASGGKVKPSIQSFTQAWRRVGYSGLMYELKKITLDNTEATINYWLLSGEGITVDNTTGEITWESRGIDPDKNPRTAVVEMVVVSNGQESKTTAIVTQAKNVIEKIEYGIPTGKTLTVLTIPARGGTISSGVVTGTITLLQTDTYSSGLPHPHNINPDKIEKDSYSDAIVKGSLQTNLTEKTKVGTLTYYYTCNGVLGSCSADVYQDANVIEKIEVVNNTFTYSNIAAGADTAKPKYSQSPKFTYTSGDSTSTVPSTTYGYLETIVSFNLDKVINGFKSCDLYDGTLFATSRGIIYGKEPRTSGVVTKLVLYKWEPSLDKYGTSKQGDKTITATCSLDANLIKKLELKNSDAGYINSPDDWYLAKQHTQTVSNGQLASSDCEVTFSSEESTYEYNTWVNLSILYTWSTSQPAYTDLTPNKSSCLVTMSSRGTVYGANSRSAKITRTATITASLKPEYSDADQVSVDKSCNTTITQDVNTISITSITVKAGTIEGPSDTYLASTNTKEVTNKTSSTATGVLTFSSEERVAANSDYGTWTGPTYSWSVNKDYISCSNYGNVESNSVTMYSREDIVGSERSADVTRTASWKFTLKDTYGGASDSNDASCSATVKQQANAANASNAITSYGKPDINIINSTINAGGGSATVVTSVTNERTYYYTSGYPGDVKTESGAVNITISSQYHSTTAGATTGTAISRYNLQASTVANQKILSHTTMSKTVGYDYVKVKATNALNSSYNSTTSTYAYNYKNANSAITKYGNVSISFDPDNITAGGGTATVIYGLTNEETWYYASGTELETKNVSGNVSISISKQTLSTTTSHGSTTITRYALTGNTLKHESMTDITGYDVVTVKATGEGSKTNSASTYAYNKKNASSKVTKWGTPVVSIGSGITAAGGDATITVTVKNTRTYYYSSGTVSKTDTNDPGEYNTISVDRQFISSSSTATSGTAISRFSIDGATLKHSSMKTSTGYDVVRVKANNKGSTSTWGYSSYDYTYNEKDAYYGTPVISSCSYNTFASSGDTETPTILFYLLGYYTSGSNGTKVTSGGTLYFTMDKTTGFSLDSSTTGKVTAEANKSPDKRYAYPKVTITINSKTSSEFTATCTLNGCTITYKIDNTSLSFPTRGGSKKFSPTYSIYYDDILDSSGNALTGVTVTKNSGDTQSYFSNSGTTITADINHLTYDYIVTFSISKTGYSSGTLTCTIGKDYVIESIISVSADNYTSSSTACGSGGGSCNITASITDYWESGDDTPGGSPTLKASGTGLSYKDGKATWSANNTADARSGKITASYPGLVSDSVTLYQKAGVTIESERIELSLSYPSVPKDAKTIKPTKKVLYYVKYSNKTTEEAGVDVTSSCTFKYTTTNSTYFKVSSSTGTVTVKLNQTGDTRSGKISCVATYGSLTDDDTVTLTLNSYHYYLEIYNGTTLDYSVCLCYNYTPQAVNGLAPSDAVLIEAFGKGTHSMEITKGLVVNTGADLIATLTTSGHLIKAYVFEKPQFHYAGEFTFNMYEDAYLSLHS